TRTPLNRELGFASSAPKLARGMIAWVARPAAPPRMIRRVSRVLWRLQVIFYSSREFLVKFQFPLNAEILSNGSITEDSGRHYSLSVGIVASSPHRSSAFIASTVAI